MTILLLLGIAALVLWIARAVRPATAPADVYYDDDDTEWDDDDYYAPVEEAHKEDVLSQRFQPGMMYRWEPIEDLLWAYGFTRDEVRAAWDYNYIEIHRDGLHAEFDGSLSATDTQGNQLYACHCFDVEADTERADRWRRQPTEDDRRRLLYR
jgi:hypothetical protein